MTSSIRRIQSELKEISENPSKHWTAAPLTDDEMFVWQFAVRGPPDTDFEGGIYTGRLVLPVNYPLAPPSITVLTPNGRWETDKKICLSISSYHPELWQPAWGIRTMMEAIRSHFPFPGDGAIGALDYPSDLRKKLAIESLDFVTAPSTRKNRELLPELSPEEMREGLPEAPPPSSPLRPPAVPTASAPASPAPGPPLPEAAVTPATDPQAVAHAGAPVPSTAEPDATAEEGLRQRRGGAASPAVPAVSEPALASGAPPAAVAPADVAVPASEPVSAAATPASPTQRRRRDGNRPRRPQQSVAVQLLKPPTTKREWVVLAVDVLMLCLSISVALLLFDVAKNPPSLLNALPEPKSMAP